MNVLLLGSGGREHAIAIALAKSPLLTRLFAAPGNPGIARLARLAALDLADHAAIIGFCKANAIDLVIVGPEAPLVAGLVDDLEACGVKAFGPSRAAAQLEGSKAFTKDFCARFNIPTAAFGRFDEAGAAKAYVREKGAPIVIKADGLAAGKGVVVAMTVAEAEAAIDMMFSGGFGAAGKTIVVEEFLKGEEASFFALCDGEHALSFASAQDHKRVGEAESGPNTGGMGAYSPAPIMDEAMSARVMRDIIEPTVKGMAAMGMPFRGVLFAGLMIGEDGPKLIEYNVRFGDPETQVMLPRLNDDLLTLIIECVEGRLPQRPVRLSPKTALSVVLAAKGYPDAPVKGGELKGAAHAEAMPFVTLTHAGTRLEGERLIADGGRVLNVTALGNDIAEAQSRAYAAVDAIDWPDGFCRRDIGWRALKLFREGSRKA
ncbi:phosphoribosylglycinamide synthetase phosphoribosylamine-glycine ligase [Methylocella tundrae]|uniref:Phosphoribosylamine--glycine ligase n=1 Tax=Methylocella tundrae TaxID=227605 RepID=A0A8B6M6G3_METTU|nr:phosphoribosylamine--glycine ligase [Methylocella tundrae]VTZ50385.1 phosphoribosylglycinamide synthetase phosphoribosylamine-glycine ligase [Methylocella tundrae]